jgi:hypothetical protein
LTMRFNLALVLVLSAAALPHVSAAARGKLMVEKEDNVSLPNVDGSRRRGRDLKMKGKVTPTRVENVLYQDEELPAAVEGNTSVEDDTSTEDNTSVEGNTPADDDYPLEGNTTMSNAMDNAGKQILSRQPKETERKKRSSKGSSKGASKGGKLVKSKKSGSKKVMKRPTGKGKGKGKGVQPPIDCMSAVAKAIVDAVPEVITENPQRCCDTFEPTAVFVTHAQRSDETASGFEPFWDRFYDVISATSEALGVCFVMTGVDQTIAERGLSEILIDANDVVSNLHDVPAMMSTDPTDSVALLRQIRSISSSPTLPSIGVFNAGFANLLIEAIVSGMQRIPFVGLMDDTDFGTSAGKLTLDLLDGTPGRPLCFNARPELPFIGDRCAAYYEAITIEPIDPPTGEICSADSLVEDILARIVDTGANAVWSHVDCCTTVAQAAELASRIDGRIIVVGCQDRDTTGGKIDFVTAQPIELQAYSATTWASFPVIQALQGRDGRGEQYFPSLASLVNTAVFNTIIM